MSDNELGPSELGTLEYWEQRYNHEIQNYSHNGDQGEIWFGEDIVERIINWMQENVEKGAKIADVGCGNGHILLELSQLGYKNLIGLDYSEKAINLAKIIAKGQDFNITYRVSNILEGLGDYFDVIHDKGTYDAISLTENSKQDREKYVKNVKSALKDDGIFILTSCNWTQDELVQQYKQDFGLFTVIPTPQFKFGGKVGNVVSICVFKKTI